MGRSVQGLLPVVLALLLAGCAGGAEEPPLPYAFEGACPFECCTYGEWTAERPIPVYAARDTAGSPRARIDSGTVFRAVTGQVIVRGPVRVNVHEPLELVQYDSTQSVRDPEARYRATADPGEPVYAMSYRGETVWNVWYRGEIYQTRDLRREFGRGVIRTDELSASLEERPETEWWVQVRTGADETGWIPMDEDRVRGNDACAVSG